MSGGDVHVFGLVSGTHLIEDISMDVPMGQTVTIPADKAARSKDLWRALSQKSIIRLPGPNSSLLPQNHVAPPNAIREDLLQQHVQQLESRCRQLEEENASLRAALAKALEQGQQLDSILKAIEQVKNLSPVYVQGGPSPRGEALSDVADGSAPQFIPSEIAPKDAQTRIDVQRQEAGSSDLSAAAGRLRRIRRGDG